MVEKAARLRTAAPAHQPINTPPPRYAALREAATYAGVPIGTMRDWIRRGLLPAYRLGPRLIQVDLGDVDRMRRRVPAARQKSQKTT